MVLINDQVLHLSSRWNSFSSSCSYQSNLLFSVIGKISAHNFEMSSISPHQAYPFRCGFFPTTPFDPSPKDAFSSSIFTEVGIFSSILLFQLSIFCFFLLEALWSCSLQPIFLSCQDRVWFVLIHLTGVSRPLFKYPLILSRSCSIPSISNRSVFVFDLYRFVCSFFQPECLHVLLVHCNLYSYVFQPTGF